MTRIPDAAFRQHESNLPLNRILATTSSDALLDAADALHAWGAENDSAAIKLWVAQRRTVQ
jgi:hypothetical protein